MQAGKSQMVSRYLISFACFAAFMAPAMGQEADVPANSSTIPLTVAKDTPLEVALDQEVRVKKVGQAIHGRLMQPLYAFDHLVVPEGTEVNGRIARIGSISGKKRVLGILNADFTPARKVEVEFTELLMADGRRIPFQAIVTPGSGHVMKLSSAKEEENKHRKNGKDAASEKITQAKQEARRQWQAAMQQIKEPGKMHRLERYALNQLPVRPQYISVGTLYFAELQRPLEFGSEPATPQLLSSIGSAVPEGSLMHALLVTPLDSATTKKGADVEAVLAQPLFDGDHLILPEGSRLKGSVVEVQPAHRLHHNGRLRIAFRQIVPPEGSEQRVVASLEGVTAGTDAHVKLDSEGGAEASTPKTRYLSTGLTLALATAAFREHNDADDANTGQSQNGVAGGAAGFRLVGIALGAAVKSQPFGMAMGAYGAARSVYSHFIARGQDVVFPKNTAMEIGIGSRGKTILPSPNQENTTEQKPKD